MRCEVVDRVAATDAGLRDALLRLWVDVTDAGGSVGFSPPAPVDQIGSALDVALRAVASGRDALVLVRVDGGPDNGRVVGMGLLVSRGVDLFAHWRTVLRVMVHPAHQGTGAGRVLVEGLHAHARSLGLEHLQLSVRGGEGLEPFYERFGYRVTGTHPGAVRLAPDDTRDEVFMVAVL